MSNNIREIEPFHRFGSGDHHRVRRQSSACLRVVFAPNDENADFQPHLNAQLVDFLL